MSEIISRQDAISGGLNKYFTGDQCKNGHIAHRYIQSGTCEQCIRDTSPPSNANPERLKIAQQRTAIEAAKIKLRQDRLELDQRRTALSEKRAALRAAAKRDDLICIRIMLHYADVDYFKAMMLALAMEIDPSVLMVDMLTGRSPESAGDRTIYTFKAFKANHTELFNLQDSIQRDRLASGTDADDIRYRAEMRRRADEAARLQTEQDDDNGRPERLDA
jgi:hypothetical protein